MALQSHGSNWPKNNTTLNTNEGTIRNEYVHIIPIS